MALTMTRRRSYPVSDSFQRSGLFPVQVAKQCRVIRSAQHGFDFAGKRKRVFNAPLRQQPCMHHRVTVPGVQHVLMPQPIEQLVAVGRCQYGIHGIATMRLAVARGDDEQGEVVVAEHAHGSIPQAANEAQGFERLRPAVYQVTDEPEGVLIGIEPKRVEKAAQRVIAALHVADSVGGHVAMTQSTRQSLLDETHHVVDGRLHVRIGE